MIFEIDRASVWGFSPDKKPCNEADIDKITIMDRSGKTKTAERYVINIDSIEDLMKLVDREGKIVIYPFPDDIPKITIYDDWIE